MSARSFLTPHLAVQGYITTTKIKFILVVEDEGSPDVQRSMDDDVKSLLFKIHGLYVDDLMNPFKKLAQVSFPRDLMKNY